MDNDLIVRLIRLGCYALVGFGVLWIITFIYLGIRAFGG